MLNLCKKYFPFVFIVLIHFFLTLKIDYDFTQVFQTPQDRLFQDNFYHYFLPEIRFIFFLPIVHAYIYLNKLIQIPIGLWSYIPYILNSFFWGWVFQNIYWNVEKG